MKRLAAAAYTADQWIKYELRNKSFSHHFIGDNFEGIASFDPATGAAELRRLQSEMKYGYE
jgi:hypothetical protein